MKKIGAFLFFILGIAVIYFLMQYSKINVLPDKKVNNIRVIDNKKVDELTNDFKEIINNADENQLKETIEYVKDRSANGDLNTKEGIKETLSEIEEKCDTSISDETKDKIAESVTELEELGLSTDVVASKAEELYDKYGSDMTDHLEELFVEAAKDAAGNMAQNTWNEAKNSIIGRISSFFS